MDDEDQISADIFRYIDDDEKQDKVQFQQISENDDGKQEKIVDTKVADERNLGVATGAKNTGGKDVTNVFDTHIDAVYDEQPFGDATYNCRCAKKIYNALSKEDNDAAGNQAK